MDGVDLSGGEGEGRVGAICLKFPQPLAFVGFSPLTFLIRAKMHKSKKETKGRRHDLILTHPAGGHKAGGPNGEVGVVVFLLCGWTLVPRRKFENWICKLNEMENLFRSEVVENCCMQFPNAGRPTRRPSYSNILSDFLLSRPLILN